MGASSESELLGEVVEHRLVGAAADADQPAVDERAPGRALLHVAIAAGELDALVRDEARDARAEDLRHRDQLRRVDAAIALADARVGELPRRGELREHLDELELRHLHLRERLAEQHALLGPLARALPVVLSGSDARDAADEALVLE